MRRFLDPIFRGCCGPSNSFSIIRLLRISWQEAAYSPYVHCTLYVYATLCVSYSVTDICLSAASLLLPVLCLNHVTVRLAPTSTIRTNSVISDLPHRKWRRAAGRLAVMSRQAIWQSEASQRLQIEVDRTNGKDEFLLENNFLFDFNHSPAFKAVQILILLYGVMTIFTQAEDSRGSKAFSNVCAVCV